MAGVDDEALDEVGVLQHAVAQQQAVLQWAEGSGQIVRFKP